MPHSHVNHNPDAPLKTFMGGRFAQRPDGEAGLFVRHPKIGVGGAVSLTPPGDPGVEGITSTRWYDPNNNFAPIDRVVTTDDNGVFTVTWLDKDGNDVSSQSPGFTPEKENSETESRIMELTVIDPASADFGRVHQLREYDNIVDGVSTGLAYTYVGVPSTIEPDATIYATTAVTAGTTQLNAAPIQLQLGDEQFEVTGAAEVSLPNIPTYATYASIRVDASADDAGVRYTTDGTAPTDDNSKQVNRGNDIILDGPDAIAGFRALAIGPNGEVDAAQNASLNVVYENIAPNED